MLSIESIVWTFLYILVAGAIFWLLIWLVNFLNPPEPFKKIAVCFIAVAGVLVLIGVLLSLIGHPLVHWGGNSNYVTTSQPVLR